MGTMDMGEEEAQRLCAIGVRWSWGIGHATPVEKMCGGGGLCKGKLVLWRRCVEKILVVKL